MSLTKYFFPGLLLFAPLTLFVEYTHAAPLIVFGFAALAIIPLAKYLGEATEHLASHTTPALGGFLNATFGNATELIIALFALNAGLIGVVQASLTGSIVANLLLVGGFALLVGGWGREKQSFNQTGVLATGITLALAVVALVIPAIFLQTAPGVGTDVIDELSILVALGMIISYVASIYFTLHTHKHLYVEEIAGQYKAHWSVRTSLIVLLASTLVVAWMSEILVGAIEPLIEAWGWTELFIGVVVVAIIGNAAEHFSAVTVALKDRMDLALQISMGSASQIAMFVAPILVLVSFLFENHMPLVFNLFEVIAIVLSVLVANLAIQDGESNWLEGLQLLVAYFIIAVAFFLHP
ncbi:MAG: calcium/proton exchanger [Patescibacteria group bacterium]|mgnify:CR=1 FL=1